MRRPRKLEHEQTNARILSRVSTFRFIALVLIGVGLALVGCSEKAPTLSVELVTGLVPGREFARVETTLGLPHDVSAVTTLDRAEASARVGANFARGHRVASFVVANGEYVVHTRLLRANGTVLVEQNTRANVAGDYVLRVHITRDCVGVECPQPGGSPALSACLNGRCVDPRCGVGAPEFCPDIAFCNSESDCGETATCASQSCDEGVCAPTLTDGACDSTEWCNPDVGVGCQPIDVVPSDPFPCGTICTVASEPCRFGYWRCEESSSPFCDPLTNRPSGISCAPSRVCDDSGSCVDVVVTTPGIEVMPTTGLMTTEAGGTATFTVRLQTAPSANVFLRFASSDTSEVTVAPAIVSFTPENGLSPQTITVTGVDDDAVDGNQPFTIATTNLTASGDYVGLTATDVVGLNLDDESAGIVVTPTTGLLTGEDGDDATFTIALQSRPTADVMIPLLSLDTSEGTVSPPSIVLTSSNWNLPQVITVSGVDDAAVDGDQDYAVRVGPSASTQTEYNALPFVDVSVTNTDNDSAGVVVAPTSGLTTTEGGGTATFSIVLRTQPSADVTIALASTQPDEGTVNPASLTFTSVNWATPQIVTVTGVDDFAADGLQNYAIVTSATVSADADYNGLNPSDVAVGNTDNDTAGITVSPTSGLMTTEAGGTATFTLVLNTAPISDVTISLTSTAPTEGTVSPATAVFTPANWFTPQTITLTGQDDLIADGTRAYTIVTGAATSSDSSYNGMNPSDVTATNSDDDTPGVTVTPTSGLVTTEAGATATFTVVLNVAPAADVTILLTSSDTSEGTVSPGMVTFTSSDWATPQLVTVMGVDDAMADGDVPYTIVTSTTMSASALYGGLPVSDVNVLNQDNEPLRQAILAAAFPDGGDQFGFSVDVSSDGNTMVVGAPFERSNATGINGDASDNSASQSGAAYVFVRTGTSWSQQAYIKASNTGVGDYFGLRVVISDDGNTVAVGAKFEKSNATGINGNQADDSAGDSGAVYVFTRSGTVWTQQAYVKASHTSSGSFGCALALSGDGNTLAVGAQYDSLGISGINSNEMMSSGGSTGSAYVFTRAGVVWSQQAFIKASNPNSNDFFGSAVALSANGNTMVIGTLYEASNATGINGDQSNNSASLAGAAYAFTRVGSTWSQEAYIKASNTNANDQFAVAVSLSADGNTLAVGADGESSNSRVIGGSQGDNTASRAGAVYIFSRSGMTWTQQAYIKTSNATAFHYFGQEVALTDDGNVLLASAPSEGAFYLFARAGSTWSETLRFPSPAGTSLLGFSPTIAVSSDASTFAIAGYNRSYADTIVNVYIDP